MKGIDEKKDNLRESKVQLLNGSQSNAGKKSRGRIHKAT